MISAFSAYRFDKRKHFIDLNFQSIEILNLFDVGICWIVCIVIDIEGSAQIGQRAQERNCTFQFVFLPNKYNFSTSFVF